MGIFNGNTYNQNLSKVKTLIELNNKRQLKNNATPLTVSFLVTNRCTLKCKHCFFHSSSLQSLNKNNDELTIDEYIKLSKSMGFFSSALLCGGEPFMREDFHEIIKIFRYNNGVQWFGTATNGQLTESILKQVELICSQESNQNYSLTFSFDGFEEQHDEIRGVGTFKKSMETWKECKKLSKKYKNLKLGITHTMNSINQEISKDFINWSISEMEPSAFTLLKIRQSPRGGESLKNITEYNYNEASKELDKFIGQGKLGDVNQPKTYVPSMYCRYVHETIVSNKRSFTCYAGKHGAWINYNGDVNVCEIFPDEKCSDKPMKIGNLRDYDMDFLKLWNSDNAINVRNLVGKHTACEQCTHETEGILPSAYFEPNISFFNIINQ